MRKFLRFRTVAVLLLAAVLLLTTGCAKKEEKEIFSSAADLAEKRVAVATGSIQDSIVREQIPDAEILYFDNVSDLSLALQGGKADAYVTDEPLARAMLQTYTDQEILCTLQEDQYAYAFPKSREGSVKLCTQISEFIRELQRSGELAEIEKIWFDGDEEQQNIDYPGPKGENGTIHVATCSAIGVPMVFKRGEDLAGYDIDILARFCRAYGYGLELSDYSISGVLNTLAAAKCDVGAASICISEERKETMLFSEPNHIGGTVMVIKKENMAEKDRFDGKSIGVISGSVFDRIAEEKLPGCEPAYFNSGTDLAIALESGKIDGFVADEPIARMLSAEYPDIRIDSVLEESSYAIAFPKDSEKSEKLCAQVSEFLEKLREDGTLKKLGDFWFGTDEAGQTVDFSGLTGENGTLTVGVSTELGRPFSYIRDGEYVGYDLDLIARFCREYGYGIKITDYETAGIIAALVSGKCDLAACCISVTEEREEVLRFSEPSYVGGAALAVRNGGDSDAEKIREYYGKRIAVHTGSISDQFAEKYIDGCELVYTNSNSDLPLVLASGKADGYVTDEPVARLMLKSHPEQQLLAVMEKYDYGYIFPKNSEKAEQLCAQVSEFLNKLRIDGTLKELDTLWFGDDVEAQQVDLSDLTGENGVLELAVSSEIGPPFVYYSKGEYIGYEIDIAARFCREYGYGLHITDYNFPGMLTAVTTGMNDFGCGNITISEERKESMLFSSPNYTGGSALVVMRNDGTGSGKESFLQSVADSFSRTFLREQRWKLFMNGILLTLFITLAAVVIGLLFGFGIFLLFRDKRGVPGAIIQGISDIFEKTPVVVILMIFYYVIFGKTTVSAVTVSVIAFSLIFTENVISNLRISVSAVERGQMEAALALGYSEFHAFRRVILPQAMAYFLPNMKGHVVSLLKSTAIVGYIAVQDLTKVSDIVRSRTYEAFFPLIASAVIYFAIAWLLTWLVGRVELSRKPERRSEKRILKGVESDD